MYDKKRDLYYIYGNDHNILILNSNFDFVDNLDGHFGPILNIYLDNDMLISGGTDK